MDDSTHHRLCGNDLQVKAKTVSENFSLKLEEGRISSRMRLPIITFLEGDASYERGCHNNQGRGIL
jgi:hypothetical protein